MSAAHQARESEPGGRMSTHAAGPPTVLVVDDDPSIVEVLEHNLTTDRHTVLRAGSAEDALTLLRTTAPDAVVVDQVLPGESGLDLIDTIRAGRPDDPWSARIPVLMLSGHGAGHDAVRAIERGADDYIRKPFHYPELLARLTAALERAEGRRSGDVLKVREITVDLNARRTFVHGKEVTLAAKEFALLAALARDPHRVQTKDELLREVWGFRSAARTRTVDSHASRLRRKLQVAGATDDYVINIWAVGYRLLASDA